MRSNAGRRYEKHCDPNESIAQELVLEKMSCKDRCDEQLPMDLDQFRQVLFVSVATSEFRIQASEKSPACQQEKNNNGTSCWYVGASSLEVETELVEGSEPMRDAVE